MKWDGEWHITYEVFRDLGLAFAAVLILIYILVVGWFQNFKTPILIMAAIPMSLIGILPGHALMGAFFTATSMIGFIAGAGIVVRNSIILVDFIELRLKQGMPLDEAVIDAGVVRFRPDDADRRGGLRRRQRHALRPDLPGHGGEPDGRRSRLALPQPHGRAGAVLPGRTKGRVGRTPQRQEKPMNRSSYPQITRTALPTMLLLLTAAVCFAQARPAPVYDLQTVIKTALEKHPSLQVGSLGVTAAQAQVRQAQAHFRPQVDAEAGYTRLQDRPSFDVEGFGTMVFGSQDNWTANIGVQYPLYTGGKLQGMKAGAQAGVRMSEEQLARQCQTVAVNAARAFYRLLEANRMVPVIADQVKALQEVLRTATAMNEQGVVPKIDTMRAQVALTGARSAQEDLQASCTAATAMLVEAMGLPPGSPVGLKEAAAPTQIPSLSGEPWQKAWQQRPDLKALEAQKCALQAQITIARSETKPQIGLFARSDFERPTFYPDDGHLVRRHRDPPETQ